MIVCKCTKPIKWIMLNVFFLDNNMKMGIRYSDL